MRVLAPDSPIISAAAASARELLSSSTDKDQFLKLLQITADPRNRDGLADALAKNPALRDFINSLGAELKASGLTLSKDGIVQNFGLFIQTFQRLLAKADPCVKASLDLIRYGLKEQSRQTNRSILLSA